MQELSNESPTEEIARKFISVEEEQQIGKTHFETPRFLLPIEHLPSSTSSSNNNVLLMQFHMMQQQRNKVHEVKTRHKYFIISSN